MKSKFVSVRFTRVLLLANAIFWLAFAFNFALKSYAYKPHIKTFEEASPPYIFWGRAFPFNEYMSPLMRGTRLIQAPSFYAANPPFWYFDNRGIVVDHLYGGISLGGYYLLLVCLLSFAQWYLVGLLVDHLRRWFTAKRNEC